MNDHTDYHRIAKRSAEPSVEPVSLQDAKTHLRISHDDEDGLITAYIAAARQMVEEHLRVSLITSTWTQKHSAFPLGDGHITLTRAPVVAVTSITYIPPEGGSVTWGASNYVLSNQDKPARIWLAYAQTWPSPQDIREAVTVTFTAGYGAAAANVPAAIRTAILVIVGGLYESREATITGTVVEDNPLVQALLAPYQWDIR